MVARLLRMADPPRPADSADALALAICHLWRGGAQARLVAAATAGRQGSARSVWAAAAEQERRRR
jgi:crossover junction endodeoxyribonuclease RuvC